MTRSIAVLPFQLISPLLQSLCSQTKNPTRLRFADSSLSNQEDLCAAAHVFNKRRAICHPSRALVQVQNIARPSRSLLEIIKDSWVEENGSTPEGNDGGEKQVPYFRTCGVRSEVPYLRLHIRADISRSRS